MNLVKEIRDTQPIHYVILIRFLFLLIGEKFSIYNSTFGQFLNFLLKLFVCFSHFFSPYLIFEGFILRFRKYSLSKVRRLYILNLLGKIISLRM